MSIRPGDLVDLGKGRYVRVAKASDFTSQQDLDEGGGSITDDRGFMFSPGQVQGVIKRGDPLPEEAKLI